MIPTPKPGLLPAQPGQEKEEPELWNEDDIPSDDNREESADAAAGESGRSRDVERE